MAEVKWIKITTSMFDDEKIKLIRKMPEADSILLTWIQLLVQAGKANASGSIVLSEKIPYTDEMLAVIFDRPINIIRLALNTFQQFGMIDTDDGIITISNWEKHQNLDGLDKIREQERLRKQRQRERQKLLPDMSQDSHGTVTQSHATDIDKELDKDKEKENIYTVFEHWNGKKIIVHKELNQKRKSSIHARLENYRVEDIIEAIDNYECVLISDDYFWTYKWSLEDFLNPKNLDKFLEINSPLINFRKDKTNEKDRGSTRIIPKDEFDDLSL
jgi:predicted phage replisome organizer